MAKVIFTGETHAENNLISGSRELQIEKLTLDDQVFGPIKIKMDAAGLNQNAVIDLFRVYRKINETGELYQSQLKKIF